MLYLAFFLSCARKPASPAGEPAAQPVYLEAAPPQPALCLSPVPEAGPLESAADAWRDGTAYLQQGDAAQARAVAAAAGGDHPALKVVAGGASWLAGDNAAARAAFRDLANAWPQDACLQQAAARVFLAQNEPKLARPYANAAVSLAPGDPDALYVSALVAEALGQPDAVADALRQVVKARPGDVGASYRLGLLYLERGQGDQALPLLEVASEAGLPADEAIAEAAWLAGRPDAYLRAGSRAGWPFGDGGALAAADDPLAALGEQLGVAPGQALYATFDTSLGSMRCRLFWDQVPLTVAVFAGLARGTLPWQDPTTGEQRQSPLYDGTLFHRVIPGFMIQGGDPLGTGAGGPGFRFRDEIRSQARFTGAGVLAMANSGPDTNGSQFFITDAAAAHLDGRHTIFGECDPDAQRVVQAIARVPKDQQDRPRQPVTLRAVRIEPGPPPEGAAPSLPAGG